MVQFHDRIWGPDVSSWQGDVNWESVKQDGALFGITKITEGIDYVNPFARAAWSAMGNVGLLRIQYHYARPAKYSASEEAAWFLANMLPLNSGDCIALDLEFDDRDEQFVNGGYFARYWMNTIEEKVGFAPMLYSNAGIIGDPVQRFMDVAPIGQHNGLWLASWNEVFPSAVPPWDTVALWQFTNSGKVPGIDGFVDLNIFNGTLETMKKYGKPGNAPTSGGNPDSMKQRLAALAQSLHDVRETLTTLTNDATELAQRFVE